MRKLLMGAGYMMSTSAEWEIVKDIKEEMTYVAEDFEAESKKSIGENGYFKRKLFLTKWKI